MWLAGGVSSAGSDEAARKEKKQKQMAVTKGAKALFSEGLLSHMTTTLSLATIIYHALLYPEIQLSLSPRNKYPGERLAQLPFLQ